MASGLEPATDKKLFGSFHPPISTLKLIMLTIKEKIKVLSNIKLRELTLTATITIWFCLCLSVLMQILRQILFWFTHTRISSLFWLLLTHPKTRSLFNHHTMILLLIAAKHRRSQQKLGMTRSMTACEEAASPLTPRTRTKVAEAGQAISWLSYSALELLCS